MLAFGLIPLDLPPGWEIVKRGVKAELDGKDSFYIVINTPRDVITFLTMFESGIKNSVLKAGWKVIEEFKLNGHEAIIFAHPTGVRKQLYWYCEACESTFLVNFSEEDEKVKSIFEEFKCH